MVDLRIEKLAKLCVHYCVAVKPKEQVLIQGSDTTFPLINEIYKECLLTDSYPLIRASLDVAYTFLNSANNDQLTFVSPVEKFIAENIDVKISVFCDPNPKSLTNIDPAKIKMYASARRGLTEIYDIRTAEEKLWSTIVPYPINSQAQEAAMSLAEYDNFVNNSCFLDKDNPVENWKEIHNQQEGICKFLNQVNEIRIVSEDTDLTFNVG